MWHRLRQALFYFLMGFTTAFVVYMFIRFDAGQVLFGLAISAAIGLVVSIAIMVLERRFPEEVP